MKFYGVLLLSLVVTISAESENTTKVLSKDPKPLESKIVGGIVAQRYEFPFIISYQLISGKHLCGGTILTKDWVLTAAHCLMIKRPDETRVVAGLLNQGERHPDVQVVAVKQQIIHPGYPGGVDAAANDIGLIQMAWSLRWTAAVQPIRLPQLNEQSSGYAWVAGWGYLSSSNPVTPTRLQQVQMWILTLSQCSSVLIDIVGGHGPLNYNMICGQGTNTGHETICLGDSGGPFVQNGKLIGVASWTLGPCGTYRAPTVYTKVSSFIEFIRYYVPGV